MFSRKVYKVKNSPCPRKMFSRKVYKVKNSPCPRKMFSRKVYKVKHIKKLRSFKLPLPISARMNLLVSRKKNISTLRIFLNYLALFGSL